MQPTNSKSRLRSNVTESKDSKKLKFRSKTLTTPTTWRRAFKLFRQGIRLMLRLLL